jgi:hypothetical protein
MLRIDKLKEHYDQILMLKATSVQLTVRNKRLSFEIDTRPIKTVIKHRYNIECNDVAIEYKFQNFQALIRLAKKFKWKLLLLDDLRLCCSVDSVMTRSYIEGKLQ